jgi:hypothetical protein
VKWVREVGWVVALALLAVYFFWLRPTKPPNPADVQVLIDQKRQEAEARQARIAKDVAVIQTDASLKLLKLVGQAYRRHLAEEKTPPKATDYPDGPDAWRSNRDGQPFVIQWGVDPAKLPEGGRGMLLAWEQTAADNGSRCVLMADGETAKVVTADEFEKLPKAAAPPPG